MASELAKIEGDGLTDMQRKLIEGLAAGLSEDEAKKQAGYSDNVPTVSVMRGKLVQNAISALATDQLKGPMKLKALKTLNDLMDSGSAQAKLGAAKVVVELAKEADEGEEDKPLSEMTPVELERLIDKLEQARASQAKDVTPINGA